MDYEYKPRFSFEITEEQKKRVDEHLATYGLRRTLFKPILDDLLDLIEQHGQMVVGILIDRAVKPREILPSLAKCDREGKKCNDE